MNNLTILISVIIALVIGIALNILINTLEDIYENRTKTEYKIQGDDLNVMVSKTKTNKNIDCNSSEINTD